jgi:hypothetical protein
MLNFLNDIGGDQNSNVPNPYFLGALAHKFNWQGLIDQRHKSDEYAQQYAELKNQELENAMKTQAQINDYKKQLDEAPLLDIHRKQIVDTEKKLQNPFDDLLNKYNGNVGDALSSREGGMAAMQYMNGLKNAITPEMRQAAATVKMYEDAEKTGKPIVPYIDEKGNAYDTSADVRTALNSGKIKSANFNGVANINPYDEDTEWASKRNPNDPYTRNIVPLQTVIDNALAKTKAGLYSQPFQEKHVIKPLTERYAKGNYVYYGADDKTAHDLRVEEFNYRKAQDQREFEFKQQQAKDKAAGKPYVDEGTPSRAVYSVTAPSENLLGTPNITFDYEYTPVAMSNGKPVEGVVNANSSIIPPQSAKGNISISTNGTTKKYAENEQIGGQLNTSSLSGKCIVLGTSNDLHVNPELLGLSKKEAQKRVEKDKIPFKTKITTIVVNGIKHDVSDYSVKYNVGAESNTTPSNELKNENSPKKHPNTYGI